MPDSSAKHYAALIEFRFHIGELYSLKRDGNENICLFFISGRTYKQFKRDRVLSEAADEINADIVCQFEDVPLWRRKLSRLAFAIIGSPATERAQ